MSENEVYTVAQHQKKKSRRGFFITLLALVTLISFVLGVGIGRATSDPEIIYRNDSSLANFDAVLKILTTKFYYGEGTDEYKNKLIEDAIKGMVSAQGDIHTEYMTPEELEGFNGSLQSTFVGIGIRYNELDGKIFVIETLYSSPAEKAGILPGDYIIAVDGVKAEDEGVDVLVSMIPGEIGSTVTVTVQRGSDTFDVPVSRGLIESTVYSTTKEGVGVVTVTSFGTGTADELKNHLERFKSAGISDLIIDLRDNGGGYAATLDQMCTYFMDNGQIVMIEEDRDGKEIIDKVEKSRKFDFRNIVILIDEGSASCSEVFTMALKENCNAKTVGTTTYGKGVAQLTKTFSDGSALKYTDVIWKSGKGVYIGGKGIEPDYEVRLHEALYLPQFTPEKGEEYAYDSVSYMISNAQYILDFLGYDVDRTDGYFSEATAKAVAKYQQDHGFEVTSTLNEQTCLGLNSSVIYDWNMKRDVYDTQMQKALEIVKQ